MGSPTQDKMETHLSRLGWGIHYTEKGRIAVRPRDSRPSLAFQLHAGSILFFVRLKTTDASRADRTGFLTAINDINGKTVLGMASADESGILRLESWWPDCYDKTAFWRYIQLRARGLDAALSEFWHRTPQYLLENPPPHPPD